MSRSKTIPARLIYPNAKSISQQRRFSNPQSLNRYKNYDLVTTPVDPRPFLISPNEYTTFVSSEGASLYRVEKRFENRLDLIAYEFFGNATLTWILIHANNITNPLSIPEGTQLIIPSLKVLYNAGGILL